MAGVPRAPTCSSSRVWGPGLPLPHEVSSCKLHAEASKEMTGCDHYSQSSGWAVSSEQARKADCPTGPVFGLGWAEKLGVYPLARSGAEEGRSLPSQELLDQPNPEGSLAPAPSASTRGSHVPGCPSQGLQSQLGPMAALPGKPTPATSGR